MADGYGNVVGYWRCHVAAWVTSSDDTSDVIHVEARWQSIAAHWNYSGWVAATVWINGQQVNHTNNSGNRYIDNSETTVLTGDLRVAKTEGARNITCSASIAWNGSIHPGTSNANVGVPVAGINYKTPNPPKNVTWTRVDDTATNLTWQAAYDNNALKPWKQVIIDRIMYTDGATTGASWGNVATLNWNAVNYKATGQKTNTRIGYALYARNQKGDSSHVNLLYLYTTPAAPKSLTAVKTETGVTLSCDASNTYPYRLELQRKSNLDTDWTSVTDDWQPGATWPATTVDSEPPAGTVTYRARVIRPAYSDDTTKTILTGEWTESNTVTTITPPLAPTILTPTADGVYPAGTSVAFAWKPNHPDGSAQSAAQVQYRSTSESTAHTADVSSQTTVQQTISGTGTYVMRVRTKGLHEDWGAWSDWVTFTVAYAPSVVVTSPSGDITASPFTVAWSVADETGVSQQRVTILSEGVEKYSTLVDPSERSLVVNASKYLPSNNARLTITVAVRGGSSLTASTSVLREVKYTPPADPMVVVEADDAYAAHITISFGTPTGSQPETLYASVHRILPDGSELLMADRLTDNQQAVDVLPPLNLDYQYRVVAYAASGAVATVLHTANIQADFGILNFGSDAGQYLRFGYDMTVSHTRSHQTSEFHFARGDGADAFPSSYELNQTDGSMNVTGMWEWDQEWYLKCLELAEEYAYAWYREPSGLRAYVKAEQSVSVDVKERKDIQYSADLTRLTWEEPVR
ncbi:fibronectin type III domain-containing protein [Bifidobacterium platyrrhinorum]|uniref:Fibronectin type-III domain-containing protein n=1 Tax=Bifidobacterium platyrrhinorum TaxID=2661628 RepID=A0A6L9SUF4_9BIFI|nr:fibronectin type III domain-containing protein [Bifidobacterium platyrrhinorum]NEG55473.1 hypothetical protein [Bifidobacterium platyrrhinorum]